MAYPPPTVNNPILKKDKNSSRIITVPAPFTLYCPPCQSSQIIMKIILTYPLILRRRREAHQKANRLVTAVLPTRTAPLPVVPQPQSGSFKRHGDDGVPLDLVENRAMRVMMTREGKTTPTNAVTAPQKPCRRLPKKIAVLAAITPEPTGP